MYYELYTMLQTAICTITKEPFYNFGLQGNTAIESIDQGALNGKGKRNQGLVIDICTFSSPLN